MKNLAIPTVLTLFITHTIPAVAQYVDPRITPFYSIGVFGGSGVVIDEGGMAFREFAAYAPGDTERARPLGLAPSGTGMSLFLGIDGARDVGRLLRVTAGVDLEHRSALYQGDVPYAKVLLPGGTIVDEPAAELEMEVSTLALGASLGVALFPVEFGLFDIGVTVDIRGRQLLSTSEEERVIDDAEAHPDERYVLPSPRGSREIDDAASPQLGLRLGLLGEHPLDRDGLGFLRIRAAWEHPLTDLVPSSDWRARTVTVSLGVAYRFVPASLYEPYMPCSGPEPPFD